MLASKDFITDVNDQLVALIVEPLACMVGIGGGFLQDGVRANHLAWDQILADAEVLKRALGLGAPELVGGNIHFAQAVDFLANVRHLISPAILVLDQERPLSRQLRLPYLQPLCLGSSAVQSSPLPHGSK